MAASDAVAVAPARKAARRSHADGGPPRAAQTATDRKLAIFSEMLYMWRSIRILFLFPAAFTESGGMSFSWRGWWTRYSVLGWAVVLPYVSAVAAAVIVRDVRRGQLTLQDTTQLVTIAIIAVFIVILPVPMFVSMPTFNKFSATWERMEGMYATLTGSPPALGVYPYVYLAIPFQVYGLGLVFAFQHQLGLSTWQIPALVYSVYCLFSLCFFWVACFLATALLSMGLARRLVDDCDRLGAVGVRMHRLLWLLTVKIFCDGISKVLLPFFVSMFVMCTVYFFNFTFVFVQHFRFIREDISDVTLIWRTMVGNFSIYTCSGGAILFLSLSAQFAIDGIFHPARKELLKLSRLKLSASVRAEILHFLDDIRIKQPVISLGGLLYLSRTSIISAVVTCSTYVAVLLQLNLQT